MKEKLPEWFSHDVTTGKKPWTHLNFGDRGDGADFNFAIIADRSGRPKPGIFEKAVMTVNRMRPDFVMSVGDYINGVTVECQSTKFLAAQWKEFMPLVEKCIPPFFFLVGNHDCCCPGGRFPGLYERALKLWLDRFGVRYYHFVYKNTLFLCLDSITGIPGYGFDNEQCEWVKKVLAAHRDVRWTFVFMHHPRVWNEDSFKPIEEALYDRNYTVIAGDRHQYTKYIRNGRKYFVLATSGGGSEPGQPMRGCEFGEFDHITWVSMCGGEPQFTHLDLSGVFDEDVVTTNKITWLTPNYFRANKDLPKREIKRLRQQGLKIEPNEEPTW